MTANADSLNAALARIPYARFLGVTADLEQQTVTMILPFQPHLIGNPLLPALHGGVIGAFMEISALMQIAVTSANPKLAKTIDIQVDYLRTGKPQMSFARARIVKIGRRIANVQAEAWQGDPTKPIALLHGHFLVTGNDDAEEPFCSE